MTSRVRGRTSALRWALRHPQSVAKCPRDRWSSSGTGRLVDPAEPGRPEWLARSGLLLGAPGLHRGRKRVRPAPTRQPVAERWDASGWHVQSTPNPSGSAGRQSPRRLVPVEADLHRRWSGRSPYRRPGARASRPSSSAGSAASTRGASRPRPSPPARTEASFAGLPSRGRDLVPGRTGVFRRRIVWHPEQPEPPSPWPSAESVRAGRSCPPRTGSHIRAFRVRYSTQHSTPSAVRDGWHVTPSATGNCRPVANRTIDERFDGARLASPQLIPIGEQSDQRTFPVQVDSSAWPSATAPPTGPRAPLGPRGGRPDRGLEAGATSVISPGLLRHCVFFFPPPPPPPPPTHIAEHWNGTSWRIVTTPNPPGATFSSLNGVSCPRPNVCFAVGSSDSGPLVELWNGTRCHPIEPGHRQRQARRRQCSGAPGLHRGREPRRLRDRRSRRHARGTLGRHRLARPVHSKPHRVPVRRLTAPSRVR